MILWVSTVLIWTAEFSFQGYSVSTTAEVTSIHKDVTDLLPRPWISFTDENGDEQRELLITNYLHWDRKIHEGDTLQVEYLPKDPRYVREEGTAWFSIILGIIVTSLAFYATLKPYWREIRQ